LLLVSNIYTEFTCVQQFIARPVNSIRGRYYIIYGMKMSMMQ